MFAQIKATSCRHHKKVVVVVGGQGCGGWGSGM